MPAIGYALFETAIGACGIAWSERGIVGVQLPEPSPDATRARLRRCHPTARELEPSGDAAAAIVEMRALLDGEDRDLSRLALDLRDVPPFHARVYELALAIPRGRTSTYGDIARRLGDPTLARAVGQALGRNPIPIIIPCHRVVGAGKWDGGFSGAGGVTTKRLLLVIDGAREPEPPSLFEQRIEGLTD